MLTFHAHPHTAAMDHRKGEGGGESEGEGRGGEGGGGGSDAGREDYLVEA